MAREMRTNRDWDAWGKVDPLYGVASLPGTGKAQANPWTTDRFIELGERDWRVFRPYWEQYGMSRESCLEIGCGAGRMTHQLAQDFKIVHAVDVSKDMLRLAREHVGSGTVEFHMTDGVHVPLPDEAVTAVFSTHVFQHFSSPSDGAACFEEVARVLRAGGTLMIHLPIVMWPHGGLSRAHRLLHTIGSRLKGAVLSMQRFAYDRGLRRRPVMALTSYDVDWLSRTLSQLGFRDVEVRVIFSDSEMGLKHPFLFARKAAS